LLLSKLLVLLLILLTLLRWSLLNWLCLLWLLLLLLLLVLLLRMVTSYRTFVWMNGPVPLLHAAHCFQPGPHLSQRLQALLQRWKSPMQTCRCWKESTCQVGVWSAQ